MEIMSNPKRDFLEERTKYYQEVCKLPFWIAAEWADVDWKLKVYEDGKI